MARDHITYTIIDSDKQEEVNATFDTPVEVGEQLQGVFSVTDICKATAIGRRWNAGAKRYDNVIWIRTLIA